MSDPNIRTIKKLNSEIKELKRIVSDQGGRHKTLQIKNDKLECEMNGLESANIYWKRRARELKVQVGKYVERRFRTVFKCQKCGAEFTTRQCERCGYMKPPRACKRCGSTYWDVPKYVKNSPENRDVRKVPVANYQDVAGPGGSPGAARSQERPQGIDYGNSEKNNHKKVIVHSWIVKFVELLARYQPVRVPQTHETGPISACYRGGLA